MARLARCATERNEQCGNEEAEQTRRAIAPKITKQKSRTTKRFSRPLTVRTYLLMPVGRTVALHIYIFIYIGSRSSVCIPRLFAVWSVSFTGHHQSAEKFEELIRRLLLTSLVLFCARFQFEGARTTHEIRKKKRIEQQLRCGGVAFTAAKMICLMINQ